MLKAEVLAHAVNRLENSECGTITLHKNGMIVVEDGYILEIVISRIGRVLGANMFELQNSSYNHLSMYEDDHHLEGVSVVKFKLNWKEYRNKIKGYKL